MTLGDWWAYSEVAARGLLAIGIVSGLIEFWAAHRYTSRTGDQSRLTWLLVGVIGLTLMWGFAAPYRWIACGVGTFVLLGLAKLRKCWSRGWDGADQISRIGLLAWILNDLAHVFGQNAGNGMGLIMTGIAVTVCYFLAGLAKVQKADWRSGRMLQALPLTGFWRVTPIRLPSAAAQMLSWAIIGFELAAPIALLSFETVLLFTLSALTFHLIIGLTMGLWSFAWVFSSFCVGYLYLGAVIHSITK